MNKNKELQLKVNATPHFEFLPNGKIKCTLTNHELLPTLADFETYLASKSFKRSLEKDFDFNQYDPYITAHKSKRDKLFCNLTRQVISRKKSSLLNHVNGKRYKYYLQKYLEELEIENELLNQKKLEKQERQSRYPKKFKDQENEDENDDEIDIEDDEDEEQTKKTKKPTKSAKPAKSDKPTTSGKPVKKVKKVIPSSQEAIKTNNGTGKHVAEGKQEKKGTKILKNGKKIKKQV